MPGRVLKHKASADEECAARVSRCTRAYLCECAPAGSHVNAQWIPSLAAACTIYSAPCEVDANGVVLDLNAQLD